MKYSDYINSGEWKATRARHLLRFGKQCEACKRTQKIHVHHRTYERMGAELSTDLAVLCENCHNLVHKLHDSVPFSTLDWATSTVIAPRKRRRR